eukprot:354244-Chlamydomonas_euryale.AAC.9
MCQVGLSYGGGNLHEAAIENRGMGRVKTTATHQDVRSYSQELQAGRRNMVQDGTSAATNAEVEECPGCIHTLCCAVSHSAQRCSAPTELTRENLCACGGVQRCVAPSPGLCLSAGNNLYTSSAPPPHHALPTSPRACGYA